MTRHIGFWKIFNGAFTLAEVLITLGIIGVIAALTMPALIANYKEKQTVVKLKKTYSVLQNAFNRLRMEDYGGIDVEDWEDPTMLVSQLAKYMQVVKYCPSGKGFECFSTGNRCKNIKGDNKTLDWAGKMEGIILNDGTELLINNFAISDPGHLKNTGMFASIIVDINGKLGPNTMGKDIFRFIVYKNKITSSGKIFSKEDMDATAEASPVENECSPNRGGSNGLDCTSWVVINGNMDYIKYIR